MTKLIAIPSPVLADGVCVPRDALDRDVQLHVNLANALAQHALDKLKRGGRLEEGEADDLTAIAKVAAHAWTVCRDLAVEQRKRAEFVAKHPGAGLTDDEYRLFLREQIRRLTPEQLDELWDGGVQ